MVSVRLYEHTATTREIDRTLKIWPIFPKSRSQKGDILERTRLKIILIVLWI